MKKQLVWGIRSVQEALKNPKNIAKIWFAVEKQKDQRLKQLFQQARQLKVPVQWVPEIAIEQRIHDEKHQGVLAQIVSIKRWYLEELLQERQPPFAVLVGISDVRNVAGIIRSAEVLGIQGIIIAGEGTPFLQPKIAKVSAGAVLHLPIVYEPSAKYVIHYLQSEGIICIATVIEKGTPIYQLSLQQPHAWVLGNEAKGLSSAVIKACQWRATIPMHGKTQSLNVSSAAAVCFYESLRQKMMRCLKSSS